MQAIRIFHFFMNNKVLNWNKELKEDPKVNFSNVSSKYTRIFLKEPYDSW